MDERESKLPKWAQEYVAGVRQRATAQTESLVKEVTELRPKVATLKAKVVEMEELLRCAARGGHMTAAGYDLVLRKEGDQ